MKNVIAKYDQNVFKQQNQTKAWNPKHALIDYLRTANKFFKTWKK